MAATRGSSSATPPSPSDPAIARTAPLSHLTHRLTRSVAYCTMWIRAGDVARSQAMKPFPNFGAAFSWSRRGGAYVARRAQARHRHGLGHRRRLHGVPDASRLRHARGRLLARQERRRGRRQDPRQPLDRNDRVLGRGLRAGLRQRQQGARNRRILPAQLDLQLAVVLRRAALGEVPVRGRLLHRQPRDRLGHDARPHEVRRLRHLRDRVRRPHLSARRPLDLGRRLPRPARHAGLRGLDRRAPLRRHARRSPARSCSARA